MRQLLYFTGCCADNCADATAACISQTQSVMMSKGLIQTGVRCVIISRSNKLSNRVSGYSLHTGDRHPRLSLSQGAAFISFPIFFSGEGEGRRDTPEC